jgi:glyoxylase-like metal-dependent hydrolase (beta-lactamase superfamily II)
MHEPKALDRRRFLEHTGSCVAWLLLAGASPAAATRAFTQRRGPVLQEEPWGRIERIAEGVWALVSTPLVEHPDARRTLCNGGIIAGSSGVLVVEGFGSDEGAAWVAQQAEQLTGRPPTHVLVTHYHGDHCNGLHGFGTGASAPKTMATERTRALIAERSRVPEERRVLPDAAIPVSGAEPLDLGGGRTVRLVAADGHTPSDVALQLDDPPVVFCGDLVWNGMFPNYMDADPPRLAASVSALGANEGTVYVPGHGTLADAAAMRRYANMLEHIGDAARRAIAAGRPIEEAAAQYKLPGDVADWTLFNAQYFRTAFLAWQRSLAGPS